jgi:hypothetical protein
MYITALEDAAVEGIHDVQTMYTHLAGVIVT